MAEVRVKIIRIVDVSYPMFVEFELTDWKGIKHQFIDKVPVVCQCNRYNPNPLCIKHDCIGIMRCNIVKEKNNTFIIDTSLPDDIKSEKNEYQFEVWKYQVTR
jgi:hypothetical protein